MSLQRRGALVTGVLALAVSNLPSQPAQAQEVSTPPIVWSGQLLDSAGQPASGEVVAFIRPSAAAIPSVTETDSIEADFAPIPLDTTTIGRTGRFELRAALDQSSVPSAWKDESGGVNVMVIGVDAKTGNWTLATDTMWYFEHGGVRPEWFSSRSNFEEAQATATSRRTADDRANALSALKSKDMKEASASERPANLRATQPGRPRSSDSAVLAAAGPPPGGSYIGCSPIGTVATSNQYRTVDMVDMATYWRHRAEYSQSLSTSWEVGYSASGSSGWSLAGSVSFSESSGEGVGKDFSSVANPNFRETWRMGTDMKKIQWRCSTASSPGPFYAYTAEAGGVNWQTASILSGDDIGCNAAYQHSLGGYSEYWREAGTSASYWGNISVWGFSGGQKVNYGGYARHRWNNDSQWTRNLCGESGSVRTGHSRVSALAT